MRDDQSNQSFGINKIPGDDFSGSIINQKENSMNEAWIYHNGLPVNIDPHEGYEAIRERDRSLIIFHPNRNKPVLVKVWRDSRGRSTAPKHSRQVIWGFIYDYYLLDGCSRG